MQTQPKEPAKPLLIVGTGGLGRETLWLAREAQIDVMGFLDDFAQGCIDAVPVLGPVAEWSRYEADIVVAIGTPRIRQSIVRGMKASGDPIFRTLIHPSVRIAHNVTIGEGTIVAAGSVLSCDVSVGNHVVIGIGTLLSHDSRFGDFATLAPKVTVPGNVEGGHGCEIAVGASLRQGLILGKGSMVGMGAVVTRNVEADMLVYGVPARPIRELPEFKP